MKRILTILAVGVMLACVMPAAAKSKKKVEKYLTTDLTIFDLRGSVRTLTVTGDRYLCFAQGTYHFSPQGKLTAYEPLAGEQFHITDYGRATRSKWGTINGFPAVEGMGAMELIYGKPGKEKVRLIGYRFWAVEEAMIRFNYDARGRLVSEVDDNAGMADEVTNTVTCGKVDSHGNWTERRNHYVGDPEMSGERFTTTVRTIVYY